MKTSILALALAFTPLIHATCLQEGELDLINELSPDQALEFLVDKEKLLNSKTCADTAEGIDFDTIRELKTNVKTILKGSK